MEELNLNSDYYSYDKLPEFCWPDTLLDRHDFWRAFYTIQLEEFDAEIIFDFWKFLSFTVDGVLISGKDLVEYMWEPNRKIPQNWNYWAVRFIEPFLVKNRYPAFDFMRKMLLRINQSTHLPGHVITSWLYSQHDLVFQSENSRELAFAVIEICTESYLHKSIHRRIKRTVESNWVISYLLYIDDPDTFSAPPYNFDLVVGTQIQYAPMIIGIEPFESVEIIADRNNLETLIWENGYEETGGKVYLSNRLIAIQSTFHDFCRTHNLDLTTYNIPNSPVYMAIENYYCPLRKRKILTKDSIYGGPAYISLVKYDSSKQISRFSLTELLEDVDKEPEYFSKELLVNHSKLLELFDEKCIFTYHSSDESITYNHNHLTKGIPAKILKHLLEIHINEGRTEFEYRDLKRIFDISLGQKNSNFEIRFYRLIEKINQLKVPIEISKTNRGKFIFKMNKSVNFLET